MRFLDLKKNLKKDFSHCKKIRLAILGDSSVQLLQTAVRGFGFEIGYDAINFHADYNQIETYILDDSSDLYTFNADYIILFFSAQKFLLNFYSSSLTERELFSKQRVSHISNLIESINIRNKPAKIIITNVAEINDSVFGQYANNTASSSFYQLRSFNFLIMDLCNQFKNVSICDIAEMSSEVGRAHAIDERLYFDADMVFSLDFLPKVAKGLFDIIRSRSGDMKKCLILDLDNTLWGGIIGDDGIENIELGDLGQGKAFMALQYWARELRRRGILLAVCSKNDMATAKLPFEKHPEMLLSLDDIAIFVANWDSKVVNIKSIQKFLNIGFDSIVFLDDNPYEREIVKQYLPLITVPDLPEDPYDYVSYLRSLNLFETGSFTEDDINRTDYFQHEVKRDETQKSFTNESEFLKNLSIVSEIKPFDSFNIPRATQLIQRSNQFNLRTIRYSEDELRTFLDSKNQIGLTFGMKDRFGNYGIICVVIVRIQEQELFIDTWVMSCRVLKRGVENLVMNELVDLGRRLNLVRIRGQYIPTVKNSMVKDHYQKFGFVIAPDGYSRLNLSDYAMREHFISIER